MQATGLYLDGNFKLEPRQGSPAVLQDYAEKRHACGINVQHAMPSQ